MNLIVVSSLSFDEGLYFRYITMIAKQELSYDILLEAQKEDVDYLTALMLFEQERKKKNNEKK